jgi:hypothetical protein
MSLQVSEHDDFRSSPPEDVNIGQRVGVIFRCRIGDTRRSLALSKIRGASMRATKLAFRKLNFDLMLN